MTKSIQFVKSYSLIAREIGAIEAVLYGIVENYSKLKKGYCYLNQVQMGEMINADYRTVARALKRLEAEGLIETVEPAKRKKLDNTKYFRPVPMGLSRLMDRPKRGMRYGNEQRKYRTEQQREILKNVNLAISEDDRRAILNEAKYLMDDLNDELEYPF